MKKIFRFSIAILTALLVFAAPFSAPTFAATPNYALTQPGLVVLPFHASGQYTATVAGVVRFTMPFRARVVNVMATARASGGTSPTLTVDLLEAGVSVLSAPIAITAGTVSEGAITDAIIADEAVTTVNFAITGTSPTWNDITIILVVLRE